MSKYWKVWQITESNRKWLSCGKILITKNNWLEILYGWSKMYRNECMYFTQYWTVWLQQKFCRRWGWILTTKPRHTVIRLSSLSLCSTTLHISSKHFAGNHFICCLFCIQFHYHSYLVQICFHHVGLSVRKDIRPVSQSINLDFYSDLCSKDCR